MTWYTASNASCDILFQIYHEILRGKTLRKVRETLESSDEDHLRKVIALTWKFVTLPNPLIVCQPKKFDPKIHDPEHSHWDKHAKQFELTYARPVVYRNYEGVVARKGWVANTAPKMSNQRPKCKGWPQTVYVCSCHDLISGSD